MRTGWAPQARLVGQAANAIGIIMSIKGIMAARKTDRQTSGKTTRWQYTAYEKQWDLIKNLPAEITWEGHQEEICPKTGNTHYQGALISRQQHRWSGCKGDYKVAKTLTQQLPGIHLEPAEDWVKLVQYCKKDDTRAPGSQFEAQTNSTPQRIPDHFTYAETLAERYFNKHGTADLHLCQWEPLHTNQKTTLISISDRLDKFIDQDIEEGRRYAAWITTNPMWTAMWKRRWKPFILSFSNINAPPSSPPSPSETP